MSRYGQTKLVPPKTETKNQTLETLEESNQIVQKEEPVVTELDNEIECPRCNDVMELSSGFDTLAYVSENCNFLLKCV
jgi:hypothetical protein